MTARLGDRRHHPRFEVGGKLSATLDVHERLRVVDIGAHGAAVESLAPLAVGAEYRAQLLVDGEELTVRLRVCRAAEISESRPRRYHLGVEFLAVSEPAVLHRVAGRTASSEEPLEGRG